MLIQVAPAPVVDVIGMMEADGAPPKMNTHRAAIRQALGHLSWGWLDERGVCLAAGGLVRCKQPDHHFHAWFLCRPQLALYTTAWIRQAQLTLRRVAETEPIGIRAAIVTPAGGRIARLLGIEVL